MKVFISFPPLEGPGCPTLGQNRQFQWFSNPSHIYPMVPASAATLLKTKGHEVTWDDCIAEKKSIEQFLKRIKDQEPGLIALETKTPVVRQHWQICEKIKDILPDTKLVLMGDHITALPEETMKSSMVDYVITGGDYDFSLLSIINQIEKAEHLLPGVWYREGRIIKNTGQFQHADNNLDDLPWIDRRLTTWQKYGEKLYKRQPFTYTMAGRDCPYGRCTFCSWTTIFPKFRVRSPENLVDEIEYLSTDFGVKEIFDDTGTFPSGSWLERFCKEMINRDINRKIMFSCNFRYDYLTPGRARMMKKAGFRLMKMGLESANQDTLDRLKKGTTVGDIEKGCKIAKEAGLEVHLTMMVGYPWETRKDAENTVKLAGNLMKKGLASMLQATVIIPYPGTILFDEAVDNNWFTIDPTDYEKMDMSMPVLKAPDMKEKEITQLCRDIYKSFLTPGYILNQLLSIRRFQDMQYYLRGVRPVLGHLMDFRQVEN